MPSTTRPGGSGKKLNLGCGARLHPAWTNADIRPQAGGVVECDVTRRFPFADASFDVVYHSHLLEHLSRDAARPFLEECLRVLRPGGILRVVVPDLEGIARAYLASIEGPNREWMTIELVDQSARDRSGGNMLAWFREQDADEFVTGRIGAEAKAIREWAKQKPRKRRWRDWLLRLFLGRRDYEALRVGRFRNSGEVHRWMYDRVSLSELMRSAGFRNMEIQSARESGIREWTTFGLDTEADGSPSKPDSLYMEARKP